MPVYPSYDFVDVLQYDGRRRRGGRMNMPVVALVGRPNVGKSALFNRIIGDNAAIVSEEAGTTRDRHFAQAEWAGRAFWLVDTGGVTDDARRRMDVEIRRQVQEAIDEADLLLFVVDAQAGLHPHRRADRRDAARLGQAVPGRGEQGGRSRVHRLLRVLGAGGR